MVLVMFRATKNTYNMMYTVERLIKDTPNKEHLSIKDKSTRPNSYYNSTF